jgi:hypothetical protein
LKKYISVFIGKELLDSVFVFKSFGKFISKSDYLYLYDCGRKSPFGIFLNSLKRITRISKEFDMSNEDEFRFNAKPDINEKEELLKIYAKSCYEYGKNEIAYEHAFYHVYSRLSYNTDTYITINETGISKEILNLINSKPLSLFKYSSYSNNNPI